MKKLTLKQFDKAVSETRYAIKSQNIAKEVLVEGKKMSAVADAYGLTPQRVQALVYRIYDIHLSQRQAPPGWEKVDCWLPQERAREVEKESKRLLSEHFKEKK